MSRSENNHRHARRNPSRPGSARRPPTTHPRSVRRRLLLELAVEGVSAKVGVVLHQLQALGGVAAVLRSRMDGAGGARSARARAGWEAATTGYARATRRGECGGARGSAHVARWGAFAAPRSLAERSRVKRPKPQAIGFRVKMRLYPRRERRATTRATTLRVRRTRRAPSGTCSGTCRARRRPSARCTRG